MNQNLYTLGYLKGPVESTEYVQDVSTTSSGEETGNQIYTMAPTDDLVNTAGELAGNSVDSSLSKVSQLMQSEEVQETMKSLGLDVVVKNTSREAVKNVLALMGIWYVSGLVKNTFKNKYVLGGVGLTAAVLYFRSSESTQVMKELNSSKLKA